jgi:hypothetical protein
VSKKRGSHRWRGPTNKSPLQFVITDQHTRYRVALRNPQRFEQLIARGIAERLTQTTARLRSFFALTSSELANNGELLLRSLLSVDGPTLRISWDAVERAWLYQTDYSPHFEDRQFFIEERQREIEMEALLWGLPESGPRVISRGMIGMAPASDCQQAPVGS